MEVDKMVLILKDGKELRVPGRAIPEAQLRQGVLGKIDAMPLGEFRNLPLLEREKLVAEARQDKLRGKAIAPDATYKDLIIGAKDIGYELFPYAYNVLYLIERYGPRLEQLAKGYEGRYKIRFDCFKRCLREFIDTRDIGLLKTAWGAVGAALTEKAEAVLLQKEAENEGIAAALEKNPWGRGVKFFALHD
jgi:hypothetical protein